MDAQRRSLLKMYVDQVVSCSPDQRPSGRVRFQTEANIFLYTVMQNVRFRPVVTNVLMINVTHSPSWDAIGASHAFEALENYTLNLYDYPWKREFKKLTLFSGFFKTRVECCLLDADQLLALMGYVRHGDYMQIVDNVSRESLEATALDFYLASLECQTYHMVYAAIAPYGYTMLDVHHAREHSGNTDMCIESILKSTSLSKPILRYADKNKMQSNADSYTGGRTSDALRLDVFGREYVASVKSDLSGVSDQKVITGLRGRGITSEDGLTRNRLADRQYVGIGSNDGYNQFVAATADEHQLQSAMLLNDLQPSVPAVQQKSTVGSGSNTVGSGSNVKVVESTNQSDVVTSKHSWSGSGSKPRPNVIWPVLGDVPVELDGGGLSPLPQSDAVPDLKPLSPTDHRNEYMNNLSATNLKVEPNFHAGVTDWLGDAGSTQHSSSVPFRMTASTRTPEDLNALTNMLLQIDPHQMSDSQQRRRIMAQLEACGVPDEQHSSLPSRHGNVNVLTPVVLPRRPETEPLSRPATRAGTKLQCTACTYMNDASTTACVMCGSLCTPVSK